MTSPGKLLACPLCNCSATPNVRLTLNGYSLRTCPECTFTWAEEVATGIHAQADYANYGDGYVSESKVDYAKNWIKFSTLRRQELANIRQAGSGEKTLLLDLGAGTGFFVAFCRSKGIDAYGVEPSETLRRFAASHFGVELFPSLAALQQTCGSKLFDVITSHDVLEHIDAFNLPEHLADIHHNLRNGGYFIGNTPNIESLNVRINGANDPVVTPPHHCLYFSPSTLEHLLSKNGFSKVQLKTAGISALLFPDASSSLAAKASLFLQKAVFHSVWPLLKPFVPDRGYQIFFTFQKSS